MSERSYCPSAKRDALSNKLQTANRAPCDSLRRGLCGGLSSYPRSRLSDHIKNLQRFIDTLGGMKSSLGTRKFAVAMKAGRGALSRLFRGKFAAGLKQLFLSEQAPVSRLTPESCRSALLSPVPSTALPARLGRLCQATLRRS